MDKTGLLVCQECWDPDHPQNHLGREPVNDPQALRNPRPDTSLMTSRFGLLGQVYNFITGLATVKRADQELNYFASVMTSDLHPTAPDYRMDLTARLSSDGHIDEVITNTAHAGEGLGDSFTAEMDTPYTFTIGFPDGSSMSGVVSAQMSILFDDDDVNGDPISASYPYDTETATVKLGGETISDKAFAQVATSGSIQPDSLIGSTMEFEITLSGFPAALRIVWVMFRVNYTKPPSVRGPDWEYYYYGLDGISYVGSTQLADGVPDATVMTLDTNSRNALIKPIPYSGNQLYCLDYNSFIPYLTAYEADVTLTGKYKRVEMRIRLIKPSSIGKSDFDGTREWFGQFKWRTATKEAGESGCSISIPEPDFFRLSGGGDDWFILTWDSKDADTAGAWEDNGDILGWRILMYKYYPTSGVQQSDSFELDYIRFLEV